MAHQYEILEGKLRKSVLMKTLFEKNMIVY